jgi:two-component system, OmpR family, osmolarity sensor histidine kinase EnvZ
MGPGLSVRAEGAWRLNLLPGTLFGRTAAALLAAFLVFETLAFAVVWQTLIRPMAERSADDLAAKVSLAAKTWVELPPQTRTDYEMELAFRHDLELGAASKPLAGAAADTWFSRLLVTALSRRMQQPVLLRRGLDANLVWLDLQVADKQLRVGFRQDRYALQAPLAAVGVFLLGAALTVVTALLMVGRAGRRLNSLAEKAGEVGQGRDPVPLPETGPREIRELTAAFNRMAGEVHALLENRTVLLSGISHDLRTPITRMKLALSLLDDADAAQVSRMERDLDEMNRLISDMLVFARALQANDLQDCDLALVLSDLAETAARLGPVNWRPPTACCVVHVGEAALRRIVGNLLENARRYGGEEAIDLELVCGEREVRVAVLDRGPGIPEDQREAVFRPFHRLESSRSRDSGGSGLGLAIARQLADAYGWRIEFRHRQGGGLDAALIISRGT